MTVLIIIPARLAARRLPNKPLAQIAGEPMIVHVWRRAVAADCGRVIVAAGDGAIVDAIVAAGGEAVLTDADLPSGTDRVHAVACAIDSKGEYQRVVNVQGDLPTLEPALLRQLCAHSYDDDIVTLAAPITRLEERDNANVVKPILSFVDGEDGVYARALYFTRACAPSGAGVLYHHIGIYAYRRSALTRFVNLPASPLELRENLEQLRALEAGMSIGVMMTDSVPLGVDSPDDLDRARQMISSR